MNMQLDPPRDELDRSSIIKTSQILTISKERLEKQLGRISGDSLNEVDRAIQLRLA